MAAEALAQVGESWDGYTILAPVGNTGLAERYRVRAEDGRTCLLDVVGIQHPELVERLRAAELDQIVDHPNIHPVEEIVAVLRYPGVVSEDTPGVPLALWMESQPSVAGRLLVFRGLAEALAAMHAAGTAHGYLQPDVVVVERRSGQPFARLGLPGVAPVVFGIIREGGTLTTAGASLGGAAFQAPEQQRTPALANQQSDMFQLGCLLYYVLVGVSPFHRLDPMACYEAARSESYPPMAARVDDLPDGVEALVQHLLRAEPGDRPTAEQLVEQLDAIPLPRGTAFLVTALVAVGLGVAVVLGALFAFAGQ